MKKRRAEKTGIRLWKENDKKFFVGSMDKFVLFFGEDAGSRISGPCLVGEPAVCFSHRVGQKMAVYAFVRFFCLMRVVRGHSGKEENNSRGSRSDFDFVPDMEKQKFDCGSS